MRCNAKGERQKGTPLIPSLSLPPSLSFSLSRSLSLSLSLSLSHSLTLTLFLSFYLSLSLSLSHLILMTGSLTIFCERVQALVNQFHVVRVDVEREKNEAARRDATNTVQELKQLQHQVVTALIVVLKT